MSEFQEVPSNLFICEGLECLGNLDPVLVDRLDGLIFRRIQPSFIGVLCKGELTVERLDLFLGRRLQYCQ